MTLESRQRVQDQYSGDAVAYDHARLETPRGRLLSARDLEIFARLLPDYREGMQVLEVGAGTGRFTLAALERGYRLIATDINEAMLQQLQNKLDASGHRQNCQVGKEDLFNLSFPDAKFDVVICLHVLPRLLNAEDQRAALAELSRVMRGGGTLIFNYRNKCSPYNLTYRGHAIRPSELADMLTAAALQIDRVKAKHFLTRKLLDRLPLACCRGVAALDRLSERVLTSLGWDVFLAANKQGHQATGDD